jgi:predicted PurR-regulated permease PerM
MLAAGGEPHHAVRVMRTAPRGAIVRGMPRRPRIPGTLRRHRSDGGATNDEPLLIEVEPAQMSGIFAAPTWLRDLGMMSWLMVGVAVLVVAAVALLALLNTIVVPVVTATIIAAVLSPLVRRLHRHMPRGAAAALVFLALVALGVGIALLVLGGIASEAESMQGSLQQGVDKLESTLRDAGVSAGKASSAAKDASSGISDAFHALLHGAGATISALASVAVFLSFTALSLFFLLKDGPLIRRWTERHMGVPHDLGHAITSRVLQSLRGYFVGVTAVAVFNAVVIGLGALVLGLPELGAIMLINFVAAYIPYLGAWSAGAFTVMIALGSEGSSAAIVMAIVVLLANGILQQMIQPIAYGAALGIHPLAVLIVTIAGGALFGTIGLILAAPLTSACVKISSDLARARQEAARAEAAERDRPAAPAPTAPAPA